MVEFLYAVRQFPSTVCEFARNKAEGPEYNIPSRYHGKANLFLKKDLIDAAVDSFRGELPKILTGLFPNINNAFNNSNNAFSLEHTYILRKLYIICFLSVTVVAWWCAWRSTISRMEFVQAVVKVATDLEMLNINGDEYDDYGIHKTIQRESVTRQPLYLSCLSSNILV